MGNFQICLNGNFHPDGVPCEKCAPVPLVPKKPSGSEKPEKPSIAEKGEELAAFWEFHNANPAVCDSIVQFARKQRDVNQKKTCSLAAVLHRVRWHYEVDVRTDNFKLNDHLSPYYSRFIQMTYPDLTGYFNTRSNSGRPDDITVNGETWKQFQKRKGLKDEENPLVKDVEDIA